MTDETTTALVEVGPGEFAVYGPLDIEGVTIERPPLLPNAARDGLQDSISGLLATGNLGLQAASALGAFEGLVRLTPTTVQMLQAGAVPMTNGAANLGSLVDASGHIVHSVQWTAAGAAGVASSLVALGPSLAMLGMQMQLARISRLVGENLRLTDSVLEVLRTEAWATVEGYHETMLQMVREARAIGEVSDNIWENVQGNAPDLNAIRLRFRREVERHVRELRTVSGPVKQREYLDHHGDAILQDVQGLLQAQAAWYTYEAIRAGHLHTQIDIKPSAAAQIEEIVRHAQLTSESDLRNAARLTDALIRRASAMEAAKASAKIPFGKSRQSAKAVARAGRQMASTLEELQANWNLADPPRQDPAIAAFKGGVSEQLVLDVLRWHLRDGEQLLATASAKGKSGDAWGTSLDSGWQIVAVTDRRLLAARHGPLKETGELDHVVALDDVRFVRFSPGNASKKTGAKLDVLLREGEFRLRFDDWSAATENAANVAALAQLLQSRMHIPVEEVPHPPAAIHHSSAGALLG